MARRPPSGPGRRGGRSADSAGGKRGAGRSGATSVGGKGGSGRSGSSSGGGKPAGSGFGEPPAGNVTVAVLERRGRGVTAMPFFDRGLQMTVTLPDARGGEGTADGGRGGEAKGRRGAKAGRGEKAARGAKPGGKRGRGTGARDVHADVGDLVAIVPLGPRGGSGRVVRRIGRPDVARDVLEALLIDRGMRRGFDPAVEREARAAAAEPPHALAGSRRDLRDLTTFTIDPPTARDFDDAISAERLEGGRIRVWIHIADVAAHVPPGSLVDREARRRSTSVYVPGLVEPMLPETLSNGACSLVPGEDRLAVTVELDLDGADVVRTAFHRSVIRSDERLTYPQVDRIFAGEEAARDPWAGPLDAARSVARALDERRAERGALAVSSSEPQFRFTPEGDVEQVEVETSTESHRLIEHLMIAANEAVAGLLESRRLPTLYRIHERPQPARVERLVGQLASLDVATPPIPKAMTAQQASDLVGEISQQVAAHVERTGHGRLAFTSLILRTLQQARYAPENIGHAGLHSPRYLHFTSPIRRYPDLIAHRGLLAAIGAGEEIPDASGMPDAGEWCSDRERDAMRTERTADDIARAFLLERRLMELGWNHRWTGEVVGVIGAGAFVAFGEGDEAVGFQGMLPVRRLRGDWWELNPEETALVGASGGRALRLGDPVTVLVERVDTARGRVDLVPADLPDDGSAPDAGA